jgi:hypothetical protein
LFERHAEHAGRGQRSRCVDSPDPPLRDSRADDVSVCSVREWAIASWMFEYAPQRQMLPLILSRISVREAFIGSTSSSVTWLGTPRPTSSSAPTAEQIWPGVQ